jgi:tripartite-type tricarboxylate transporter receptor subunit TctC
MMFTRGAWVVVSLLVGMQAWAQGPAGKYPDKPVRVVVTVPPAGASDFVARSMSDLFGKELGATIIVDNKAGANGTIASAFVAKAPTDGYTILQAGISTHGIGPYFYEKLTYDPFKDLVPVAALAEFPMILAVNAQLPVTSVKELLALAQKKPLSFASAGTGSAPHLSGELLKILAGVDMLHVPYNGSGSVMPDLLSGQINSMYAATPNVTAQIKEGKLRAIAVTTPKRFKNLPNVPTIAELGYPKYDFRSWFGIIAPAGTPRNIIDKLNAEVIKALKDPAVLERLDNYEIFGSTPDEFGAFIRNEIEKTAQIIKVSGAKID